jgi:SAM-dependent methyltransferase
MSDIWRNLARQWRLLGPPLRPSPEDVAIVARVAQETRVRDAVLLGVTPEIATSAWLTGTRLVAVDVSQEMIDTVWPAASAPPGARALRADWRALPLGDASADLVTGDGALTVVPYPDGTDATLAQVRRVLRPGGHFVVRAFVAPPERERAEAVVEEMTRGRIAGFHAFRWRLAHALERSRREGSHVADVWRAWNELVRDPAGALAARGWSLELLETIDNYRDSRSSYWFPSVDEIRELARGRFELVSTHVQGYELADRCPTLVLRAS